jgi:hypothetical protein
MPRAPRLWFNAEPQRTRAKLTGLACVVALLATGCNEVDGTANVAKVPPASAADLVSQSLRNLSEAGTVRYRGALRSASGERIGFDLTAATTGEMAGSITLNDAPGTLLVINKALYLNAPAAFWVALRGLGNAESKSAAIADRWVTLPSVLLGVEFSEIFTPDLISQSLASDVLSDTGTLADAKKSIVGGVEVISVPVKNGTVFLTTQPPHGIVKLELSRLGNSDTTRVSQLVAEVSDVSTNAAAFYQDIANRAVALDTTVDVLTTVEQGPHRFDSCAELSCSLVVEFTNTSKVPVRVEVTADWTGDNAPMGNCAAQVGPVAPGAGASATCTLNSPAWVDFYRNAHTVAGNHPYSAAWTALVLADAPDRTPLAKHAGAKPADPGAKNSDGSHYVYMITYADQVWKYGMVAGNYWQDHAAQQLATCLAVTRALCFASLVTAVDEAASGLGLQTQLVQTHRSEKGSCPAGQWVSCPR